MGEVEADPMTDLLAARSQMALSLGFHILFAVAGMAMPLLMVAAEWLGHRRQDPIYLDLARRWAKGTAILFAVGAVSGTVLSFELGLLWPRFMEHAGPIIGMPFSLEGFAFFVEAIFLGIYLYGWNRVPPRAHLLSGVMVAVSGLTSGVFVVSVNAWMNTPAGFSVVDGQLVELNLWDAFFNPAFPTQATHMALAAYASVAFAVLAIHAWRLMRDPGNPFHIRAARIAFVVGLISLPLQILSGDLAAKHLADAQPTKLAAAEGLFETQKGAPLTIGGLPDVDAELTRYGIELPKLLSVLAQGDPNATVKGLDAFPKELWPPVPVVHVAFQIMVACGFAMLALLAAGAFLWWRRRDGMWRSKAFLRAAVAAGPLGLIAVESGWTVTEVGRQPWIIRGVMRTAEAVTPMPGLVVPFITFSFVYLFLGVIVVVLLRAHVFRVPDAATVAQLEADPPGQPEQRSTGT